MAQEALASLGGQASEDEIAGAAMARLLAEEPTLMEEFSRLCVEAEVAAVLMEDGYTVDADGRIHPPDEAG